MNTQITNYRKQCDDIAANSDNLPQAQRLHKLFEIEWAYRMASYPEEATYHGYSGHNDRWTDLSTEAIESRKGDIAHTLKTLETFDRDKLDDDDRLSYDIFHYILTDNITAGSFSPELLPLSQLEGPHINAPEILNLMPMTTLAHGNDAMARLEAVPALIRQTIELMKTGLAKGLVHPHITLRDVPKQISTQLDCPVAEAPMLKFLQNIPKSMPDADRSKLEKDTATIYTGKIISALKELKEFVENVYLPGCSEAIGCASRPNGRAWYEFLVRSFTTTQMTPDDVFTTGEQEVARIHAEMEQTVKDADFKGSFEEFTKFLQTDPQFFFTEREDLVREYRNISKRADPELIKLFGKLPTLPYGVIPIAEYMEKSQTTAYYQPGSPTAGRPGYYYVNTYAVETRPKWEMEALSLHEAVPGHHLQIAIAQELTHLPAFRRHQWITSYGEGWALYSESLGTEMGFFTDPYSRFGQLAYQMWRATRLIVDVGLHYKGWSRRQAIDYMVANTGKSEHDITVEVDRYLIWPGQAVAYKIGELCISRLRQLAAETLGEKLDLRQFHDEILTHGPMQLDILEKRIKDWVAGQSGR
jgi:uncharacterized protein (DUF885 family)